MTNKPLTDLSPTELRIRCAEAMGWKELSCGESGAYWVVTPDGNHCYGTTREEVWYNHQSMEDCPK